jgi:hypothetical protein
MELTIADRLNMLYGGLLPEKANLETMARAKDIKEKLTFSTEQIDEIGLETLENGTLKWNDTEDKKVYDIDFKPKELVMLDSQVTELDSKKEITATLLEVCQKIKESV